MSQNEFKILALRYTIKSMVVEVGGNCGLKTHRSWCEALQSLDGDLAVRADLVIVVGAAEGQWEHTLLLQVGLCGAAGDGDGQC